MQGTAATDIMRRFAERTRITSANASRRSLWTDAFAVCNFLGLAESGDDPAGRDEALALIDKVHHVLGRHRGDDGRSGWISGLGDAEGEDHPTAGGLRIGKPRPERAAGEPADPRAEWDQDGQYFHYLTRWMHALDQTARHTGDGTFRRWARELAATAVAAFTYVPAPDLPRRMYWKMSIDLSRPQVTAMGHHDPLDGYLTCLALECPMGSDRGREAAPTTEAQAPPTLEREIALLAGMVAGGHWATEDPLGLGGLMADAYRLLQIEQQGGAADPDLLPRLLHHARVGLEPLRDHFIWRAPAERRLAFRELGLAIGLEALPRLAARLPRNDPRHLAALVTPLTAERALADRVVEFWLEPAHQQSPTWTEHRDINEVMLATALAPDGYLELAGR